MNNLLAELTQDLGKESDWEVSKDNIFIMVKENWRGYETRPNWALIIPLVLVALAAVIALVVFLYRRWRRTNCVPISLAGKTVYAKQGETIANAYYNWFSQQQRQIESNGLKVSGWYTDPNLQTPLDFSQPVYEPVIIYPKIKRK